MNGRSSEFVDALLAAMRVWAVEPSQEQIATLQRHYESVVEGNRRFNLTRITEPREAAVKHYADSLSLAVWVDRSRLEVQSLLDIGTGAGFPAVPLAVMRPTWQVTAIDSTRKKTDFLSRCATELQLTNLEVQHAHARHWKTPQRFDVVTMRAIGALSLCVEQAAPFVARQGYFAVYKTTSASDEERRVAQAVAAAHDLVPADDSTYELHLDGEVFPRVLCVYQRAHDAEPAR